jgi:predicted nucleic acid-binding Zn ribbon protein
MERRAKLARLPPLDCVECGAQLHVTRSDVRYCSTRCRVRAHRRRTRP